MEELARAKINLYLHVTGKRPNGYHTLCSLVMFADMGDRVSLAPAEQFALTVTGPFALAIQQISPHENIIDKAAHALAAACGRSLDFAITLEKTLPVGSGIGGGSADAAAVIRLMLRFWNMTPDDVPDFDALLLSLGADVPMCFYSRTLHAGGVGEDVTPLPDVPAFHAVLIYPDATVSTADIFRQYSANMLKAAPIDTAHLSALQTADDVIAFLHETDNHLAPASTALYPQITDALAIAGGQAGVLLHRMSGSGSCCFALCDTHGDAVAAAQAIKSAYPSWWVQTCLLGG